MPLNHISVLFSKAQEIGILNVGTRWEHPAITVSPLLRYMVSRGTLENGDRLSGGGSPKHVQLT